MNLIFFGKMVLSWSAGGNIRGATLMCKTLVVKIQPVILKRRMIFFSLNPLTTNFPHLLETSNWFSFQIKRVKVSFSIKSGSGCSLRCLPFFSLLLLKLLHIESKVHWLKKISVDFFQRNIIEKKLDIKSDWKVCSGCVTFIIQPDYQLCF